MATQTEPKPLRPITALGAGWRIEAPSTPKVVIVSFSLMSVAAAVAAATGSSAPYLAASMLIALAGLCYLAVWTSPATFIGLALAGTVFSGHSSDLGLPIGPDRLLVAAALVSLTARLPGAASGHRITFRPIHVVLAASAAYAVLSAMQASTLMTQDGFFALLDRFGLVPMLIFSLTPIIFGTARSRNSLLVILVSLGGYLSLTAFSEQLGIDALVFPKYILDPSVGIHFGRARGPFVEAVASGLALYACGVAAAVAAYEWQTRRARFSAVTVLAACLVGTLFTLTRAVWLATIVATIVALALSPQTRRMIPVIFVGGSVALLVALTVVPGLAGKAEQRTADNGPVWERYATNSAAIRAVKRHPTFGIGWQQWTAKSKEYLRKGNTYPLTRTVARIEIHNVPLSHAAELGLIGASLWALGLGSAVALAVFSRTPSGFDPWRLGMVALFLNWAIVASFGPLSYAFPNLLLWMWAGICAIDHLSEPVETSTVPPFKPEVLRHPPKHL